MFYVYVMMNALRVYLLRQEEKIRRKRQRAEIRDFAIAMELPDEEFLENYKVGKEMVEYLCEELEDNLAPRTADGLPVLIKYFILKMKTLVMSTENINKRKKFQKPNILRKKAVVNLSKPNTSESAKDGQPINTLQLCVEGGTESNLKSTSTLHFSNKSNSVLQSLEKDSTITKSLVIDENIKFIIGSEENRNIRNEDANQALVNIEAFFNDTSGENVMYDIDYESGKQLDTIMVIDKSPVNGMCIEESPDLINSTMPFSTVTSQEEESIEATVTEPPQNNYTFSATVRKYKCDAPNCKKEFRSEQKLQKHKRIHNEDGTIKPARQVTVECPVKKIEPDGTGFSCGRIFLVRELLVKHLNEDHTPDDASYRCKECGRRFFWASGLRAHARAHWRAAGGAGAGAALVCGWSGCGRVFRQPCRLREHARAHTGDRPYHCQFPNCGWSFRSASKLERHARRHTGERRHACGECASAFLRRDHLRDHHARHHAQRRLAHACTHPGCEQTFNNMSTLYMHMKKVHKSKEASASETATTETIVLPHQQEDNNTFVVNLASDTGSPSEVTDGLKLEAESASPTSLDSEYRPDGECRAARTHCTWPLPRPDASPAEAQMPDEYVFSEQVDQSENSESNIYTVRSDLFLHGNVMINDDSEQSSGAVDETNDPLDPDLGMLDAHPGGDLMQEELMYTDVAADESSFRIFLLSGEELT